MENPKWEDPTWMDLEIGQWSNKTMDKYGGLSIAKIEASRG